MSDIETILLQMNRRIKALEAEVNRLQHREAGVIRYATSDTDNPPTNAQLDALFGDASTNLFNGFVGIVFDSGALGLGHLAVVANDTWWVEALTLAS